MMEKLQQTHKGETITLQYPSIQQMLKTEAYLFSGVDGGAWSGGGCADRGAGGGARGADRVDFTCYVMDLPCQDGQILGKVLTDPTHTGK